MSPKSAKHTLSASKGFTSDIECELPLDEAMGQAKQDLTTTEPSTDTADDWGIDSSMDQVVET